MSVVTLERLQPSAKKRLCKVRRYPDNERGTKDPQMLQKYMSLDGIVVTFDRNIVDEHGSHIPDVNPGIIMISNFIRAHTMTAAAAQDILKNFKALYADWHLLSWNNSIINLTDASVEVGYMRSGKLTVELRKVFTERGWQDQLRTALEKNVKR